MWKHLEDLNIYSYTLYIYQDWWPDIHVALLFNKNVANPAFFCIIHISLVLVFINLLVSIYGCTQ